MDRGRSAAAVLAELLPASGPLLEIGVGTGLVAAGLAELGRTPVGVDLSVPMLARAAERIPGRLAVADAHRLPVRSGSVAGAYLVHVLHLVGDVAATLAEVARVLRPGGTLVATAFPAGPVRGDVHEEMDRIRAELGAPVRDVDAPLVTRLAGDAGFELVDHREEPGVDVTPRNAADRLEERSISWMWTVEDEVWARRMPAAVRRLRALPDQDRVRPGPGPTMLALRRR